MADQLSSGTDFPELWYDLSDKGHFWFQWRAAVLSRALLRCRINQKEQMKVLEIGCGSGVLSAQIEDFTNWAVDGVDLNHEALSRGAAGRGRRFFYNVIDRAPHLAEAYDGVVLFDVLEHLADPIRMLQDASFHIKPGGFVLVNVPARKELFSRYDEVVGHLRRYDRATLHRQLVDGGFFAGWIGYWGLLLVPIAIARRFLVRFMRDDAAVVTTGFKPPSPLINRALALVMKIETWIFDSTPVGSSVMAIYFKRS
jgi:SAM-dependent methyltransferase